MAATGAVFRRILGRVGVHNIRSSCYSRGMTSSAHNPTHAMLEGLNPPQREAAAYTGGALLILAGPGSGKTRVIAHRIANLVRSEGVPPYRVLAVTFTNKAARELRHRVHELLGDAADELTLGTFHSVCARWLRIDGARVGLDRGFVIYDDGDQMALMKSIIDELNLDPKRTPPRAVLSAISRAKSEMVGWRAFQEGAGNYFEEIVGRAYERYAARLRANNAVDFDDLLVRAVELLRDNDDMREKYAGRYLHVLVDEFQDTNIVQYVLAKQLASTHGNICVVGDPDQSIYSWRSADIRNIMNFERDYPGAKLVLLEQNYRSTQTILDAAHAVISRNRQRKDKQLWTENGAGSPITFYEAYDETEEAEFLVQEVRRLRSEGVAPGAMAVMYRTNAQSRPIEEAFVRYGLPYRLVGGPRFYERREVKDVIAYLRMLHNPVDSIGLSRIVNVPPRGIGDRTVAELARWAADRELPLVEAVRGAAAGRDDMPRFQPRITMALTRFIEVLDELAAEAQSAPLPSLIESVIERTGYRTYLQADEDGEDRLANVMELLTVAEEYTDLAGDDALLAFLEDVALVSDADQLEDGGNAVTLITLHTAKGLEFPVVFMTGMEEGVLPHIRSFDDPEQMEEERRLCYVGITRAKDRLYLVRAFRRALMGSSTANPPSRFLRDVPEQLVTFRARDRGDRGAQPRTTRLPGRERAALHASAAAPADVPAEPVFAAGDRVEHAKFGVGLVVSCVATRTDQEVTVAFTGGAGIKKLLLSFAGLQRAGG